ncbi:MAG: hypothetical protein CL916_10980 [Deltaproteobacteria bacterium]|nr:hypothetical protein [Deltaproteobacteria bacterium]
MIPLMASRNAGSAKMLKGKTYSLLFFLSDEKSEWNYIEKQKMLQQITDAEIWLIEQAKRYNHKLQFEHGLFGWEQDIHFEEMPQGNRSGKEDVFLTNKIIQKVGYKSQTEIINQIPADNIQLLFLFKRDGVSYAFPYSPNVADEFFLEGMSIYHRFNEQTPQCTSCIAHEMLHLFGAWDLYRSFQTTKAQEDQARKRYPNSIMLRTSYNIDELNIDPVTAWRIGWIDSLPTGAEFFRPIPQ